MPAGHGSHSTLQDSPHAACVRPILGCWFSLGHCPLAHETDAIQIATNALLDAAEEQLGTNLLSAGYRLLAVERCDAISQPVQRDSIVSYLESRGLGIVFVDRAPAPFLLNSVCDALQHSTTLHHTVRSLLKLTQAAVICCPLCRGFQKRITRPTSALWLRLFLPKGSD